MQQQLIDTLVSTSLNTNQPFFIKHKWINQLSITENHFSCNINLPFPCLSWHQQIKQELTQAILNNTNLKKVDINLLTKINSHSVQNNLKPLPKVKNIIAVASGKGGVGKSTTAVNLALALQIEGAQVGILDGDIYGPSIPTMLGINEAPISIDNKHMQPLISHSLQANSIGLLIKPSQAMIWRGPMAVQALEQLLRQTKWLDLDYLIIDLPPGTGDIQLSLSQRIPVTGAVIVSTPQDVALIDARKAITMFNKVNIPILGLVENMAVYQCINCGHQEHIFGQDGVSVLAKELQINYLAALPLLGKIREQSDKGIPMLALEADSEIGKIYRNMAIKIAQTISHKNKDYSAKFPNITVTNNS